MTFLSAFPSSLRLQPSQQSSDGTYCSCAPMQPTRRLPDGLHLPFRSTIDAPNEWLTGVGLRPYRHAFGRSAEA